MYDKRLESTQFVIITKCGLAQLRNELAGTIEIVLKYKSPQASKGQARDFDLFY